MLSPTVVDKTKSKFTHYIGRPSVFGNPFVIGRDGDRAEVIEKYRRWVQGNPAVMAKIQALPANAVLGCFCKPEPCHGDIIVALWKEMNHD